MDFYQQQHQQIPPMASGLTRFRSAPSSYFASILNTADTLGGGGFGADDFATVFNPRASSPEAHRIFARFMNSTVSIEETSSQLNPSSSPPRKKQASAEKPPRRPQNIDYSSPAIHQPLTSAAESSYNRLPVSIKSESVAASSGGNHGLVRHSSLPAGLFDTINIEISTGHPGEDRTDSNYIPDFPMSPWDESTILSDDFIKGLTEGDAETSVISSEDQKTEFGKPPPIPLSHHLSLPKSALEKLVQDSVPCKLRAKRGCATHPRSIAERVRRNKISDRTRKLQELVPNMDRQTSTADMLDLAVDYIKDLQKQVQTLSDNRAKCICPVARMKP
ncbi:transcription factor bHLH122-like [Andrographis paniculata]|uniref:transcription factor bHLH122-like n=1 Tax=Andrographis paniculata TaxID=175694 RepID=UPI0021E80663|nr:transcription factor bHLH122-like [Andrographis paniculata]